MNGRAGRVFTIPAHVPFLEALADGLIARYFDPHEPAKLASVTVLLPTRRAARALGEHLLHASRVRGFGDGLILPRVRPLGDIDEDAFAFGNEGAGAIDVPPALPPLRRTLLLMRLVTAWADARKAPLAAAQALKLALALEDLLDRIETQEVALAGLESLAPADLTLHWAEVVDFLRILTESWPAIEATAGVIGPARRRSRLMEAQRKAWAHDPPDGPVLAAGSTGTIPASAALLAAVAQLPEGRVILPGLDLDLDPAAWQAIDLSHPQGAMKALIERMGLDRADVALWPHGTARVPASRARLLNEALRPWEATAGWRELSLAAESARGLYRLDLPSEMREASVVALILRGVLETPKRTAALVTPDRRLAEGVRAALARWGILVDDSAGQPLALTAPGVFLRLLAEAAAERLAPVPLLALLKHPFARLGLSADAAERGLRRLEERALRGPRPAPGLAGLRYALSAGEARPEAGDTFLDRLAAAIGEVCHPFETGTPLSFASLIEAHIRAAEALARTTTADGSEHLWAGEAGEALATLLQEALAEAAHLPHRPPTDYPAFLDALLAGRVVRPVYGRHPRLFLWGPLEARLQKVDVVVLGGLNEGTWPAEAKPDPWLSRGMLKALGLPPPEQRHGLSAHDFVQCASQAETVYLTRAQRVDGSPTVPSRWLVRLETLLTGAGKSDALIPPEPWLAWAEALDAPSQPTPPIGAPQPRPPVSARPRQLAVTQIERWVRDPYAIYARYVLGLRVLPPLDEAPDGTLRGRIVHEIAEAFSRCAIDPETPGALNQIIALGRDIFAGHRLPAAVRSFWWPRFCASAAWLLREEREARGRGERLIGAEVKGSLTLEVSGDPFILTARADRIDRTADGHLVIADYKTGTPPGPQQIEVGLAPQLPLEALIAMNGGFEAVDAASVSLLRVIRLMGGRTPGEITTFTKAEVLATAAGARLKDYIVRFDDPAMPYRARLTPKFAAIAGDYDHLARVKEWSVDETDEDVP